MDHKREEKKDDTKRTSSEKVENPTINDDNHNKHQDNDLKNLHDETAKLKKDVDKLEGEKKDDRDVPKARIVELNEDEKKAVEDSTKDDKMDFKTEKTELLHVIANQTIATLQGRSTVTGMKSAPLSSYVFGKVARDVGSQYGISPFRISPDVPQLFKFRAMYNEAQQVNIPDMIITRFTTDGILDTVSKSIEIFNISTMTVRTELNDSILSVKLLDPNDLTDGSIKLITLVPSGRENPQANVNFVESRIFSVLTAFEALNDILIKMPKKLVCIDSVRGGPTAVRLAEMPFYENLHPHPYYSVFSNLPEWAREYFNESFKKCPLEIGDIAVDSYAGMKLSQINKLVIDQFTAAVLRLNFNKMRNHTLTTDKLHDMVEASMFKRDKLEIEELVDIEDITLLYDYTSTEYNLTLFHILTSLSAKQQITDFLTEELTKTNRFGMSELENVWKGLQLGDVYSQKFNSDWIQSIHIGDNTTPYQMLIYETFADFFYFQPKFSSLPDSLNAVTEILSIYTFMILYPRITQRIIHKLGYRLTQLYNTMFPQVFNDFKMKYGDVRTNFGADKFEAYGKQLTIADSQNGYVYSIFTTLPMTSQKTRQLGLLHDFVSLINSLRLLTLPTISKVELTRKRKAGYPYLYDSYSTYMSWAPLDYMDYSINEETTLGIKLRSLIGESNRFKELFLKQNPASSQIPRAFEAYYTAWTTQLSKLIVSAGSTYQITAAMMQETLFNSPFYVGSTYNPNPDRFWYVQKDIGIGPLVSSNLSATIIPTKLRVDNFKINVGMCLALTVEGEYLRNVITPDESEGGYEQNQTRVREDITCMDGVECFKMMNKLVSQARSFGYAMQVTQWMTMPNSNDNPFKDLVYEVAEYMKMAYWVPLIKKVFNFFGVNFQEYFTRTVSSSSFIADGRYLDRTLVIVDPSTSTPQKDQPINSKFNVKFEYITPDDVAKLDILTRPLISSNSKIIYVQNDWYFGKMVVGELGPTQKHLKGTNWTDETTYLRSCRFYRSSYKNGQVVQLEYTSEVDGKKKNIILPYDTTNTPILLIKFDYLTEIPNQYLKILAKAISLGKIIIKVKYMKLRVFIEDKPSRTDDYSLDHMSEDEVFDVLMMPAGTIRDWTFTSTNYATNFSSNALVIPSYIQWFATEHEADKNILVSSITNAIVRPSQTRLPLPEEMGYGPDEEGTKFPNNASKIDSNIINWNNSIPTVSDKLLNTVKLKIIPWYPQYLGTS